MQNPIRNLSPRSTIGLVRAVFLCALCVLCVENVSHAELPKEIRVVTYNIHHGEGTDGKFDLERIAHAINAEKPDLVGLNEVDQGSHRTNGVDIPAEPRATHGHDGRVREEHRLRGGQVRQRHPQPIADRAGAENHKLPSDYENSAGFWRWSSAIRRGRRCCSSARILITDPNDHERMASVEVRSSWPSGPGRTRSSSAT